MYIVVDFFFISQLMHYAKACCRYMMFEDFMSTTCTLQVQMYMYMQVQNFITVL